MLTVAAAPLRIPKALMIGGGMRSWGWLMRKFSSERSVCAPQYLSAGTWISPKASLSVRVSLEAILIDVEWRSLGAAAVVVFWRKDALGRVGRAELELHDEDKHVLNALVAALGTRSELRAGPDTAATRID